MDPIQPPTQEPVQIPDFQPKPNYLKTIIFSVLVIATLGLIAYLFFQNQKLQKQVLNPPVSPTIQAPSPTPQTVSSISIPPDETASWKTYENNYWKIIFKYPESLLKPCPNYTTEKEGIRFWGPQFTCPDGHDILYKIGFVGYDPSKYIEPKKPSSTESIVVDGKQAQKKTYIYDESDGPLSSLKQSVEIVFNLSNGIVVLQQLGINVDEQKTFTQILSTFKFIDNTSVCVPTYQVETNSVELTAEQNYSVRCTEQRSEKDCLSIDLYNQKAGDFSIPDYIPDCIWKNPTNTI